MKSKEQKTLNDYRSKIEDEIEFIDIKPFSSNIISINLLIISQKWGKKKANDIIRDLGLEEYGWRQEK